jgi:DNA-directed RNA polymerase subunit RPC12/RpoP
MGMNMEQIVYKCDRCKKKVDNKDVLSPVNTSNDKYEVCNTCLDNITLFIENKSLQEIAKNKIKPGTMVLQSYGYGNSKIEMHFDKVNPDKEPNPYEGWPETKLIPSIFINGKKEFTGTEVDCTGCSKARWSGHVKLTKQCFDWILDNAIH